MYTFCVCTVQCALFTLVLYLLSVYVCDTASFSFWVLLLVCAWFSGSVLKEKRGKRQFKEIFSQRENYISTLIHASGFT